MIGMPFIDDYRCTDWRLTVLLLLIETLLVTAFDEATFDAKAKSLGAGSALMVIGGYHAELTVTDDLTPRWIHWFILIAFLLHVVQRWLVSLSEATELETNEEVKDKIQTAREMTMISEATELETNEEMKDKIKTAREMTMNSWSTYFVMYFFIMDGRDELGTEIGSRSSYCVIQTAKHKDEMRP